MHQKPSTTGPVGAREGQERAILAAAGARIDAQWAQMEDSAAFVVLTYEPFTPPALINAQLTASPGWTATHFAADVLNRLDPGAGRAFLADAPPQHFRVVLLDGAGVTLLYRRARP